MGTGCCSGSEVLLGRGVGMGCCSGSEVLLGRGVGNGYGVLQCSAEIYSGKQNS